MWVLKSIWKKDAQVVDGVKNKASNPVIKGSKQASSKQKESPPPHDDDGQGSDDTAQKGFQSVPELYKAVQEAKVSMGLKEFRQFCQEVGLLEEGMTFEHVDLIFSEVSKGMGNIDVFEFHTALWLIAEKKGVSAAHVADEVIKTVGQKYMTTQGRLAKVSAAPGNLDGSAGQASSSSAMEDPAPPRRPKGMVLPENVTQTMKDRQYIDPQKWSMTIDQLVEVLNHCQLTEAYRRTAEHKGFVSMYDVDAKFVQPWSRGTGCGISVLMNPDEGVEAQLMLSHAWGEDVQEFKEALLSWQKDNQAPGSLRLWFCVFANYQCEDNAGPNIAFQLSLNPFASVIESKAVKLNGGRGMVAIHTTTCDLYGRLWCVHEVERAITAGVEMKAAFSTKYTEKVEAAVRYIMTLGGSFDSALAAAGVKVETAMAACSRDEDRKMLIEQIVKLPGQFEELNAVVSKFRQHALPDLVMWGFLKEGYIRLDSIDKYDRAFMLAILALGNMGIDRFDELEGKLLDDPCVQLLGCRATTMSRKFASRIAKGLKMNAEHRPKLEDEPSLQLPGFRATTPFRKFVASQIAKSLSMTTETRSTDDVSDGLSKEDADMNSAILRALRHIHYDVLLLLGDDESVAVRAAAEKVIHSGITTGEADAEYIAPPETQAGVALIDGFDAGDWKIRQAAAQELGEMGERAPPEAVAALVGRLKKDAIFYVIEAAAEALFQRMGVFPPEACVALIARLDDGDYHVRQKSAQALGKLGERAPPEAFAALAQFFRAHSNSDDWLFRASTATVAHALSQIAPTSAIAAEAFAALAQHFRAHIKSDNWQYRCTAAMAASAIGQIDPTSEIAVEALAALTQTVRAHIKSSDDAYRYLAVTAARAIVQMDPTSEIAAEACVALIGRFEDGSVDVRKIAARGLETMGERAPPEAVVALIGLLDHGDEELRAAAAESLGKIGERTPTEVVAKLLVEKWLQHAAAFHRYYAARICGKWGERAPSVVAPALAKTLATDQSPEVREAVAKALRNVLTGNNLRVTAIVAPLLRGLQSDSYDVKSHCMRALTEVLKATNHMSNVWTQELAQRFETTPEEIDERVKLVCEGDIEAARFLSRPPLLAAQPAEQGC